MFSQYSWWDFIKLVLALAIPYYAYVLWTYYREDIREWISNRGQPKPVSPTQDTEDEEKTPASIFTVNDYSVSTVPEPAVNQSGQAPEQVDWLPAATTQETHYQPAPIVEDIVSEEVELQGPTVDESNEDNFALPLMLQAENPVEQSIDEIIHAAGRIETDNEGVFAPMDADDMPAAKIAALINNQQGRTAFSDFAFTR